MLFLNKLQVKPRHVENIPQKYAASLKKIEQKKYREETI